MAQEGPNFGSAVVTVADTSSVNWTNPTYVLADDGNYATCSQIDGSPNSYFLNVTAYDMSGISGTVDGIEVYIEKYRTGVPHIVDKTVQLIVNGTAQGSNYADTSTFWNFNSPITVTYGGETDLWGLTLSPADVMASNFGLSFQSAHVGTKTAISNVGFISAAIFYTPDTPGSSRQSKILLLGAGS